MTKKDERSSCARGMDSPFSRDAERHSDDIKDGEWEELEARCVSTIWLCIGNNVFNHVIDEEFVLELREKLEKIYLAKSIYQVTD